MSWKRSTPTRGNGRRPIRAALSAVLAFAAAASAQQPLLDLTKAPSAPAPGQGAAALALVAELDAQITRLLAHEPRTPGDAAAAAIRRAARDLIAAGEKAGREGSTRILLGRTLYDGVGELDALLPAAGEPTLVALVADLNGATADLAGPAPERALRDALAPLTLIDGAPNGPGWIDDGAEMQLDLKALAGSAPPDAGPALAALAETLATADRWPAYAPSARRVRLLLRDAQPALSPPAWITPAAAQRLTEAFSASVVALSVPESRDAAVARLMRLCRIARVIALADSLGTSNSAKDARAAIAQAIAIGPTDTAADAQRLAAAERILGLCAARTSLDEDSGLIRQLRPVWRPLVGAARRTEDPVLDVVPEVLRRPEAMTDPAVLAAIAAHTQSLARLQSLRALSAAIAAPDPAKTPELAPGWERLGARLLKMAQDLARANTHDAALAALLQIADHVPRLASIPGEMNIRIKGVPAHWAVLTGGRAGDLAARIDEIRHTWAEALGRDGPPPDAKALENLAALVSLIRDVAEVAAAVEPVAVAGAPYAPLQSWPGWQLAPETVRQLVAEVTEPIASASRVAADGNDDGLARALPRLEADAAPIRLIAELMRRAAARSLPSQGVLGQVATGAPWEGVSWLSGDRGRLAEICRYADEWALAQRTAQRPRAAALRAYLNRCATEALDALNRT